MIKESIFYYVMYLDLIICSSYWCCFEGKCTRRVLPANVERLELLKWIMFNVKMFSVLVSEELCFADIGDTWWGQEIVCMTGSGGNTCSRVTPAQSLDLWWRSWPSMIIKDSILNFVDDSQRWDHSKCVRKIQKESWYLTTLSEKQSRRTTYFTLTLCYSTGCPQNDCLKATVWTVGVLSRAGDLEQSCDSC